MDGRVEALADFAGEDEFIPIVEFAARRAASGP